MFLSNHFTNSHKANFLLVVKENQDGRHRPFVFIVTHTHTEAVNQIKTSRPLLFNSKDFTHTLSQPLGAEPIDTKMVITIEGLISTTNPSSYFSLHVSSSRSHKYTCKKPKSEAHSDKFNLLFNYYYY